jgi:Mn-dependent DtxR family transcriptional regulator
LLGVDVLMSRVLQDDLKKFVSEPQPPPHGIEIPQEGKAKAKEW